MQIRINNLEEGSALPNELQLAVGDLNRRVQALEGADTEGLDNITQQVYQLKETWDRFCQGKIDVTKHDKPC